MSTHEYSVLLTVRASTDDIIDIGASIVNAVSKLETVKAVLDIDIQPIPAKKTRNKSLI